MKNIQDSILNYACSNKYFSPLIKLAHILAVIYPIYLLATKITVLSVVWKYVGLFSAIFFIAYYIGTILCFANNKLIPLDVAYGCMTFYYVLSLQYGISLNRLIYICFYGLITGVCIVATKKTSQWNQLKETTFNKAAEYAATAGNSISSQTEHECTCPKCGKKIDPKMNFCNNCGNQINH